MIAETENECHHFAPTRSGVRAGAGAALPAQSIARTCAAETAMKNGRIDLLDHGFVRLVDSMGDDLSWCVLPVSLMMQRGELAKIRAVISG